MNIDHAVIRALSVPTRVDILNALDGTGATPTDVSEQVGKSKSTVVSHLSVLEEAGLVEKDVEDGRRRVIYRPTDTATAIVEGRTRTVTFSILGTVLAAGLGLAAAVPQISGQRGMEAAADGPGVMSEAATATDPVMLLGGAALLIAAAALGYLSLQFWRLGR